MEKKFEVREDEIHVTERIKEGKLCRYKYASNECREPFEVIRLAKSVIGDFNFNGINNNCSHFARSCKAKQKPVESSGEADAGCKPKGASRGKCYGYGDSGDKKRYGYGDSSEKKPNGHGDSGDKKRYGYGDSGEKKPNGHGDSGDKKRYGYGDSGEKKPNGHGDSGDKKRYGYGDSGEKKA